MSDESFAEILPVAGCRRRRRFCTVFAPFSTVYRRARQPRNAVVAGFFRVGLRKGRLKTAKTVETAAKIAA
jgi:hypothetical protein